MARGKIIADYNILNSTASKVEKMAEEYEAEYESLFKTVDGLKSAHEGKDNVAFTNQIAGFRDDFQRMARLMKDYAVYLRKVASDLENVQNQLVQEARGLTQGS